MPMFSRLMFQAVHWAGRGGFARREQRFRRNKKLEARRTGVRGETYAYWYLRRNGYVFVARNYTPRGIKSELDLVGYDGKALAFVEVRTRTVKAYIAGLAGAQRAPGKAARCGSYRAALPLRTPHGRMSLPVRQRAIDNRAGQPPVVRLYKDAFSPRM
jgi:hypothetical protein